MSKYIKGHCNLIDILVKKKGNINFSMVFIKYIFMHKSMGDIGDILHWFLAWLLWSVKFLLFLLKKTTFWHPHFIQNSKLCLSEEGRHILCLEEEICQQIMVSFTCLNVCTVQNNACTITHDVMDCMRVNTDIYNYKQCNTMLYDVILCFTMQHHA